VNQAVEYTGYAYLLIAVPKVAVNLQTEFMHNILAAGRIL